MTTQVEREYLIRKALFIVTNQYGKKHKTEDFDIRSIPGERDYPYGYEIWTVRTDDALRIRLYLNIGKEDDLSPFILKVEQDVYETGAGDEVYVAYGSVSYSTRDAREFTGKTIAPDPFRSPMIMIDGEDALLVDEDTFLAI